MFCTCKPPVYNAALASEPAWQVSDQSLASQIVVAYLMRQEGLSRDEALQSVAQQRPIVGPNEGFMRQLQHWQVRSRLSGCT